MRTERKTSGLSRSLLLAFGLGVILLAISWIPLPGQSADGKLSVQAWGHRYDDRDPQIAVDWDGNSYVVWERYTPDQIDDVDVYWRHVYPDGTLGAVLNLADGPDVDNGLNEYRPRIDLDPAGNSYVVWYGQTTSPGGEFGTPWVDPDFEIFLQRVATDGASLSTPLRLTDNDRDDLSPEIAVDGLGNWSAVVWRGWTAYDWDLYWQGLSLVGTPTVIASSPRNVTSNGRDDRHPGIGVDPNGDTYVAWESQRYIGRGDYEIYWQTININGMRVAGSTNLSQSPGQDDAPQIAVDEVRGNSFIVWQGRNGSQWDIYWRMVGPGGTPVVNQCFIGSQWDLVLPLCNLTSDYTTGMRFSESFPQVALDANANSYVVWEGHDYRDTDIYWRRISQDGSATGVLVLSDYPGHYYENDHAPQIAVDGEGNSYVVWQGSDGYEAEIYWRRVNADGTLSPVVQITDNRRHPDRVPVIGIDQDGNSKVAYQGWDGISWAVWWRQVSDVATMSATVAVYPTPTPTPVPWIP